MERKEAIRGAYRMTGGNNFYDGMITCSTLSGTFCGCFYVKDEHKRTDWFVRHVYEKAGFFTPPYETVSSLKARLDGMYTGVDMGNLKSMAWFVCRKAE